MKFFHYILIGFILSFALGIVNANEQKTKSKLSFVPVKIVSAPASQLQLGGTVIAHKSVVLSAQLAGRIVNISGEEGDQFEKGHLLVKINSDELLAKRQTALAQLASADSAVRNANVQLSRQIISPSTSNNAPGGMGMPGMFDQLVTNPMSRMMGTRNYGIERDADIIATRSRLDQAYHAAVQASWQIQQIDSKLRDTQSLAPFAGTIVKKSIEIGDTVQPGQSLLIFEDLTTLQIIVDVPSRLIQNLHQNQVVKAQIDSYQQIINVSVAKIFPTSDPLRHTTRVKFTIAENNTISPGNYAEVRIPINEDSTQKRLIVPATAVINRGGLPSVFLLNKHDRLELHLVRVGDMLPSGELEILHGVKPGQKILDKPASYMTSGFQIKSQKN
jgi:RND family efflux transporter MFP subunit